MTDKFNITEEDIVIGRTFTLKPENCEQLEVTVLKFSRRVGKILVRKDDGTKSTFDAQGFIHAYAFCGLGWSDDEEEESRHD